MQTARKIINTIIVLLILFQIIGYLGASKKDVFPHTENNLNKTAYLIGFNAPLILASLLLILSLYLKKRIKRRSINAEIEEIGKNIL